MATVAASLPSVPTHWLFTRDDLEHTPSVSGASAGGVPSSPSRIMTQTISPSQERVLRGKGVHLIFKMGEFLQLPQHVLTTACTFFHRFFMRKPLQISRSGPGWSHYEIAATCVFLACKSEESLRKLTAIVDAAMASLDKSPEGQARWAERSFRANQASHEFLKWRDCILLHEETLLTTLCVELIVPQPHAVLVRATRLLHADKPLARLAWTVLNDCLRDPVCILYDAPLLAAGAFRKACETRGVDPAMFYAGRPDAERVPPEEAYLDWLDVFDVDEEEAQDALDAINRDVYEFHGPQQQQRAAPHGKVSNRGDAARHESFSGSRKPPAVTEAAAEQRTEPPASTPAKREHPDTQPSPAPNGPAQPDGAPPQGSQPDGAP